jgi:twitching motility protein PilT
MPKPIYKLMDAKNKLYSYLNAAVKNEASDIHFIANETTKFRIKDTLIDVGDPLSGPELRDIILSGMTEDQKEILKFSKEVDFGLRIEKIGRFRVNAFTSQGNIEAVLRVIKEHVKNNAELHLPEVINRLATLHDGLILVSGATGSGKSTTLAAMIDHINTTENKRIITVEDPVEIVHRNKLSVISQREVGEDTPSFGVALKSLMRQNPDVILIGEIRDKETATSALQAAQTGHLVLSTIHASSAEETINRFAGIYPAEERPNIKKALAFTLKGVIAQRLIVDSNENKIPVMEIMTSSRRIQDSILADANDESNKESLHTIIQEESINDMVTTDQFLINLVIKGEITKDKAIAEAHNVLWTRQQLQLRGL